MDSPGTVQAFKDVAFGSAAGMVSKVFEHPFDLTKVRLQAQVLESGTSSVRFNGPIDCLTKTWRNEGFLGLYRGLPAPVVGAMFENASLFLSYNAYSKQDVLPLHQLAIAAAGSAHPSNLSNAKCKFKCSRPSSSTSTGKPPGPISLFFSVLRREGFRGLWLGQTGTLIREIGGNVFWFGSKELVSARLLARRGATSAKDLQPWESAFAGACAGLSYNVSLFPADTVKSAMQTEMELRGKAASGPPSFWKTFRAMWKARGVRGLYAGMGVTIARSVPSSAMIFLIYDTLDKRFG
ncbi:mitochondrial carrier [Flagelloscypha sp. PMI_526]|nr:mitochondrial carrier [Flagelloscypha sp. PMI_526]